MWPDSLGGGDPPKPRRGLVTSWGIWTCMQWTIGNYFGSLAFKWSFKSFHPRLGPRRREHGVQLRGCCWWNPHVQKGGRGSAWEWKRLVESTRHWGEMTSRPWWPPGCSQRTACFTDTTRSPYQINDPSETEAKIVKWLLQGKTGLPIEREGCCEKPECISY